MSALGKHWSRYTTSGAEKSVQSKTGSFGHNESVDTNKNKKTEKSFQSNGYFVCKRGRSKTVYR